MQQSLLFLWRFILMLIRIRWSKEAKARFQEFECSSLFAFNSCVYCTTRYNKCGRIGTRWLYFFTYIEECCIVMEKNIGEKLSTRFSYQIWYKRCLKGKFGRGVQICQGGSISASVFGPGGVQIRCDAGHSVYLRPRPAAAGSKSQPIFKPAKHRRVGALLILRLSMLLFLPR